MASFEFVVSTILFKIKKFSVFKTFCSVDSNSVLIYTYLPEGLCIQDIYHKNRTRIINKLY